MVDHVLALSETWTWNAVAYAASHCRTNRQTAVDAPRSTWIHCGSLNALDQRVPALPSTAALAGVPAFSTEDAMAGLPWATFVLPQVPVGAASPKTWNSHSE